MSNEVFANGMEISCKAGDAKVIAAFPDVCLSPPSPPAGPIPIPYPNTSFSKDMKNGSKSVKIDGKEIMLKDKSYFKTSPLGNEAATRSFGGSVISHVITGKTYFVAWSMDVKIEGQNVDRHVDLTTSNHASPLGSTPPNPDLESATWAALEEETDTCACCHQPRHSDGKRVTMEEWYTQDNAGNPVPGFKTGYTTKNGNPVRGFDDIMDDFNNRKDRGCACPDPPPKVAPEPPCNVFRQGTDKNERAAIRQEYDDIKDIYKGIQDPPLTESVMHLTPVAAGGCPTGDGNLQGKERLCTFCQGLDDDFTKLQGSHLRNL